MNLTKIIKEFFNAYTLDGKIYNCSEGELIWYHEKGHIERFKDSKFRLLYGYTLLLTPFLLILFRESDSVFSFVSLWFIFIMLWFEFDAWLYAFNHKIES